MQSKNKYYIGLVMLTFISLVGLLYFGIQSKNATTPIKTVAYEGPQIPVYPGATLITSNKGRENSFIFEAIWKSPDPLTDIESWYEIELPKSGWQIVVRPANIEDPTVQLLTAQKNNINLNLSFIRNFDLSITSISAQFFPLAPADKPGEEQSFE